ncbi:MAG: hypothetical protein WDZ88_01080 [Candidatus Paceibacterota bacterium]
MQKIIIKLTNEGRRHPNSVIKIATDKGLTSPDLCQINGTITGWVPSGIIAERIKDMAIFQSWIRKIVVVEDQQTTKRLSCSR